MQKRLNINLNPRHAIPLLLAASLYALPAYADPGAPTREADASAAHEQSEQDNASGLPNEIAGSELAEILELAIKDGELEAVIAAYSQEASITGDAVDGWSEQGIYLPEYLANAENEGAANIMYGIDTLPSVQGYGSNPFAMPADYRRFVLREVADFPLLETYIVGVQEGFWLEARSRTIRIGNAVCYSGPLGIALHTNIAPENWSDDAMGAVTMLYGVMKAMEDVELCSVYSLQPEGKISAQLYDPDGRPYVTLNELADTYEVRQASESAELVTNSTLPVSLLENLEN